MFDRLLNLPIDFFERTPTGEIVHDMYEIYKVRAFLTNQMFGTLLDSFVLVVFLPIMFLISTIMTAVVLTLCLLMCLIVVVRLPAVRRKVGAAMQAEVDRGTILVEAVHGMRTIKSLALDARQRHQFDVRLAKVAELRFDEGITTNWIQTLMHPLEMADAGRHRRGCGVSGAHDQGPGLCRRDLRVHADVAAGRQADPAGGAIDRADRRGPPGDCEMRRDRQPAARSRPLGARHPHPDRRPDRVQRRDLPLSGRGVAGARSGLFRDPRGQRVRDRRAQRIGQDDRDPAAAGTAQRLPRV